MKKVIYILSLVLFASCGNTSEKTTESSPETSDDFITVTRDQFENGEMTLGKIQERTFPVTVETNGMIDVPPENKAVVSATMGGYIRRTPLLVGDIVKKGQLLVTLENPEFVTLQQDYLEAKQQLAYLESEYERQKTLREENITSQKSFLKSESDYKTTNARYNGLKKQLEMINISTAEVEKGNISSTSSIYAPISGSITQINVTKGAYVSPASPILEIIDNDHIHLELSVFERDIMTIKKGQDIRFQIPEASKTTFEAEVHLIGASIDEKRTIKVHGHLKDESDNHFLTGMFVNAEIVVDTVQKKALPSEALVTIDDTPYALLLQKEENNTLYFKQLKVETGLSSEEFTALENSADLPSSSAQFLTKGAFNLIGE
ncbi:efflux RND transporter periplasmic adaptor subunit [Pareuzebyella sediminis]|uniref:efflux RND transporter periplasmic adaptor subunit n=1 Tax=Pareuzebyella sediminis TaxID=2607998 RepID=UPI0011EBB058|nr:efflux RND transporter periplasmic adaptor subunit [Pareuzebyella sediminis]